MVEPGKRNKSTREILDRRRAGVLLHPSSLPGCGDLGPEAYHFVDFLVSCGASVWQVLPLVPSHDGSPYMGLSAIAGNPDLISLFLLQECGWLPPGELGHHAGRIPKHHRKHCIRLAKRGFEKNASAQERQAYDTFIQNHRDWLHDFALFMALREEHNGAAWFQWPGSYRDRESNALKQAGSQLVTLVQEVYFEQFLFFRQWNEIRKYANERGVLIFGDMPIFVAHDSAEVWANRGCFDLHADGSARTIAGVPPDYFSETGQRWGNPHYDWKVMKQDGFAWWRERVAAGLEQFDLIRVDHFRGFEAFWQIKAEAQTAIEGKWVKAPGKALFSALLQSFDDLPLVAEDLGIITPEVTALRDKFGFPGMKILQFAFDGDANNDYLPHNHVPNSVVYTGTHDNNTTLGWYEELDYGQKRAVYNYLGYHDEPMPWAMIRAACASVSRLVVVPMQDLLALNGSHRMNRPGVSDGNWQWRFNWNQIPEDMPTRFRRLLQMYGRDAFPETL